ncbi:MAG: hypothetical protein ACE5FQ_02850 [Thiogranum sp.]
MKKAIRAIGQLTGAGQWLSSVAEHLYPLLREVRGETRRAA